MKELCDFMIGSDKVIEDINIYLNQRSVFNTNEEGEIIDIDEVTVFLRSLIGLELIILGEKCEGVVSINKTRIKVEYQWCSQVGSDWNDDSWESCTLELTRMGSMGRLNWLHFGSKK